MFLHRALLQLSEAIIVLFLCIYVSICIYGDVGSNPTQGEFSFKHLLKNDYLGCIGLAVLSYTQ